MTPSGGEQIARGESADDRVGSLPGDDAMLLLMPDLGIVGRLGIAKHVAEDLAEEIPLHLGFFEPGEPAGGLHIGPFDDDRVGGGQLFRVQSAVFAGVIKQPAKNQPVGLRLSPGGAKIVGEERGLRHDERRCSMAARWRRNVNAMIAGRWCDVEPAASIRLKLGQRVL